MTVTRLFCVGLAATAAFACRDRSAVERPAAGPPVAQSLVGVWDVAYTLDQPTLLLSARRGPLARAVRGRIAFLVNRWADAPYPGLAMPTNYGTYEITFTPFGFEARSEGQPPTAVAGALGGDSIEVLLGPSRDRVTFVMRGRVANDSITGTWTASIARIDGAGGHFLMIRTGKQSLSGSHR
jgi:hypothetical protein